MFGDDKAVYTVRGPMGVPVEIGSSLVFLIGFVIYGSIIANPVDAIMWAVMILAGVFLHELGHAWGCKVYGIPVKRIILHGFGGLCVRTRTGARHEQEFIVLMGPLVNLALWAVSGLLSTFIWVNLDPSSSSAWLWAEIAYYLSTFSFLNLMFFAFNLLPVQPLDGGKLFHLLMLRLLPPEKAHRVTGFVGLTLSLVWIPTAIFIFLTAGWVLLFVPSIAGHYRMMRGDLAF